MIAPLNFTSQLILQSLYKVIKDLVVAHGYLPDADRYTDGQTAQYFRDRDAIIKEKGFCIDLFSQSSQRHKDLKDTPRIVMFLSRVFEGEIGYPGTITTKLTSEDGDSYVQGLMPGKTANVVVAIHLLSITSEQTFVLNAIYSQALGMRKSIPFKHNPEKRFWIMYNNFSDLDNPIENFTENVYFHTVPDVLITTPEIVRENIPGLKEIKTETETQNLQIDTDTIK